ncbi:class I SAM-dependent methyltransferase [Methylocystis sp. WRRC1]|uniref:class I SAM-dependent methyltransferase n=1 Tax=Methylocystis sp. WRRC1 TaxID=1732014 RepID=UPI001D13F245|nr:class I SAM-dependent methyltransferase [Methylocystis sp. WRRC1]MCC3245402.1 class I SAM-dependent methyltransferase [Methylocystis sp. WRRC1]
MQVRHPIGMSFGQDAGEYFSYRPQYPRALFAWLNEAAPARDLAWDCGTGSGQSAVALAEYFNQVLATDPDQRQLDMAPVKPNIRYALAAAETDLGLRGEVDLITCACSAHWFDLSRFYAIAIRSLKPRGVIAVWTYDWPWTSSTSLNVVMQKLKCEILGPFWGENSAYYFGRYENLPFPFIEIDHPPFHVPIGEKADDLQKFLSTWSAVKKFRLEQGKDPLSIVDGELRKAWATEPPTLPLMAPLHMRAGRCS